MLNAYKYLQLSINTSCIWSSGLSSWKAMLHAALRCHKNFVAFAKKFSKPIPILICKVLNWNFLHLNLVQSEGISVLWYYFHMGPSAIWYTSILMSRLCSGHCAWLDGCNWNFFPLLFLPHAYMNSHKSRFIKPLKDVWHAHKILADVNVVSITLLEGAFTHSHIHITVASPFFWGL